MHQWKRTIAAVLLAMMLAVGVAVPVSQPACAAVSVDGWATQTSGTTWTLFGVWGDSSSSIFASGEYGTILHYNGSTWTPMSTGVTNVFFDVWGSSSDNVFAVGQNGIIMHYDGVSWSAMTSNTSSHLHGVWGTSSSDVFAVGNGGTIMHYDGTSWSLMANSNTNHLRSVWGSAPDDVFAAGNGATILHYDGISWTSMAAGNPPNLSGVWGSAGDDVFVVGNTGTILHYDGISWSEMTSGVGDGLDAVWGTSGDDVFAAGQSGRILHYDGTSWTAMTSGVTCELQALWGNASLNVYAVGQTGTILHYKEPAPIVVAVNPSYGDQGETLSVVINGNNFSGTTAVSFGADIAVDNFTINGDTQITAVVTIDGDALSGPRDVTVTNADGTGTLDDGFSVPFAAVTTVNPNSGNQGQDLQVVITGTNLGAATGLSFGFGIAVDPPTVQSPTQITAHITIADNAMAGTRDVSVMTPGYTAVLEDGFSVNGPAITAVDPDVADQGETLDVTISGSNLTNATAVDFGDGITVNGWEVSSPIQVTANITIDAAATPGNRDVTVTTTDGPASLAGGFAVEIAEPVISGVTPASGIRGQTLDVTISGSHLNDPSAVSFGDGIAINYYSTDNATQMVVNITIDGAATLGAREITVTAAGGAATLEDAFAVGAPEPALGGVSPASGIQGQTLDVTISGSDLNDPSAVSFGDGIAINDYGTDNATQMVVNITIDAMAAAGDRDVIVTTAGGTATLESAFAVVAAEPTFSGLSPASGIQGQTLDVTITGTHLDDPSAVSFGDGIEVNSYSAGNFSQMVVNITIDEMAATGDRDVIVTTAGGTATTEGAFAVGAAEPTLSDVSPASGIQGRTLDVTISGTHLDDPSAVSFGDGIVVNSYSTGDFSQMVVNITIDAAATLGARDITVTTDGGTATLEEAFEIGAPEPTLSGVSPASGIQGRSLSVVITGANLIYTTGVDFGQGITVTGLTVDSDTQLTASIAIGTAAAPGTRNVSVVTLGGTATIDNGFTVATPPIPAPSISGVSPGTGYQGQTLEVVITGANLGGATSVHFGDGLTVDGFMVDSPTRITVNLTIADDATPGSEDVIVTTPAGTDTLEGCFDVVIPAPSVENINIPLGRQGETLDVIITGTRLDGATAVNLGDGITVNSFTVDSASQITASITIDKDAETGPRDVSVVTPGGDDSLPAGFDVEQAGDGYAWWMWLLVALAVLLLLFLLLASRRKKSAAQE